MALDQKLTDGISYALNESEVAGLRLAEDRSRVDLLLHVLALPPIGPIDPDSRRIIVLSRPSLIEVVLQQGAGQDYGPAIPLSDMDAVNAFLLSLTWSDEMYGWPFLDGSAEARTKWPSPISLEMAIPDGSDDHSLYWFAECGWNRSDDDCASFFLQGMITFGEIEVQRANGDSESFDEFIADADRWWAALKAQDERISVEAQHAAQEGTPKWRSWQMM